ncbi:MAG: hypothetical protein WCK11_04260 [Candidatus Falkowbacteria bacterium]
MKNSFIIIFLPILLSGCIHWGNINERRDEHGRLVESSYTGSSFGLGYPTPPQSWADADFTARMDVGSNSVSGGGIEGAVCNINHRDSDMSLTGPVVRGFHFERKEMKTIALPPGTYTASCSRNGQVYTTDTLTVRPNGQNVFNFGGKSYNLGWYICCP